MKVLDLSRLTPRPTAARAWSRGRAFIKQDGLPGASWRPSTRMTLSRGTSIIAASTSRDILKGFAPGRQPPGGASRIFAFGLGGSAVMLLVFCVCQEYTFWRMTIRPDNSYHPPATGKSHLVAAASVGPEPAAQGYFAKATQTDRQPCRRKH